MQRRRAEVVKVAGKIAPRPLLRAPDQPRNVQHQLAEQLHQPDNVVHQVEQALAQLAQWLAPRGRAHGRRRDGEFFDVFKHAALLGQQLQAVGPALAPLAPQQLRTEVVELADVREAPLADDGGRRFKRTSTAAQGVELDRQRLPGRFSGQAGGCPRAQHPQQAALRRVLHVDARREVFRKHGWKMKARFNSKE